MLLSPLTPSRQSGGRSYRLPWALLFNGFAVRKCDPESSLSHRCDAAQMGNPRIWIATVLLLHAVSVGRCAESSPNHSQIAHSQTARLNPDLAPEQYEYREWTINDGLPSDQVFDIVQTHDGYLWLATERGLARFDGLNFTTFNRFNTPAFVTNRITKLCKGRDGTLWIGTQRGGVIRCRFGQPPKFQRFDELLGKQIRCLFEDRAGTLWIGTATETWTVTDGVLRRGEVLR